MYREDPEEDDEEDGIGVEELLSAKKWDVRCI